MRRYQIHGGVTFGRMAVSTAFDLGGLKKLIFVATLGLGATAIQAVAAADADFEIGNKLADMLRASRSVVSASQGLINDPEIGDKGFTGDKLIRDAEAISDKGY